MINTKQFRAPEVILQCFPWNEITDVWSIACTAIELYTGNIYFNTNDSLEQLAMIQKTCGLPYFFFF